MTPHEKPTRRGFLDGLIVVCSTVAGLAMAIPGVLYLWPAAKGGAGENVEVEGADALSLGQSKTLRVGGIAVIVVRGRDGFKAFSAVCTHLGCLVKWDSAKKEFICPCHAATFDDNGQVVSGPPPGPLPIYRVKEIGGKVFVSAS